MMSDILAYAKEISESISKLEKVDTKEDIQSFID
jgi:hypothetical protein